MKRIIWLIVVLAFVLAAWSVLLIVDQTEYAVVMRFGDPHRTLKEPGLYVKWPDPVDRVVYFDNRLLVCKVPGPGEPPKEFLTRDKKNIQVAGYFCWRITDPKACLEGFGTRRQDAESRLGDVVLSELGKVLGGNDLDALLSTDPQKMKLPAIMGQILATCRTFGQEDAGRHRFGVEIVDFRIRRISFPEQNRASVFERMRAERKRIATQYRSEGEKEAAIIRAEADKQAAQIMADSYRRAQEIEGKADAEAARIYAAAYGQDPEFYEFLRTLQSYETSLKEGTTIFLPADSPYLKWLRSDAAVARPSRQPKASAGAGANQPSATSKPANAETANDAQR